MTDTKEPSAYLAERVLDWPQVLKAYSDQIPTALCLRGPIRRILSVTSSGDKVKFVVVQDTRVQKKYDEAMEEWAKDPGEGEQPGENEVPFYLVRLGDRFDQLFLHNVRIATQVGDVFILIQSDGGGLFGSPLGSLF